MTMICHRMASGWTWMTVARKASRRLQEHHGKAKGAFVTNWMDRLGIAGQRMAPSPDLARGARNVAQPDD